MKIILFNYLNFCKSVKFTAGAAIAGAAAPQQKPIQLRYFHIYVSFNYTKTYILIKFR